ncbi:SDR family oxidoreductase [Roseateles violae]|uniref:SDR family oxidoreductase n=1 Tax=Roseateles violae TaxID=3058042 RepID=A0ABT8DTK9_9BURK|nr:SDR family oxidoreductase [Pelomonas sp. PFR6]MDN3921532.1 SDR family oxidoreductase [Pelomonas sp. PFR6]
MVVLLTGATGFLGSHLLSALLAARHQVVCVVRRPSEGDAAEGVRYLPGDFARDHAAADWLPRLDGVDAVINAVGILREQGAQRFEALHLRAPSALFQACAQAGVQRVLQISALGADEQAASAYHLSKKAADELLLSLPLPSVAVIQPSLLYGPGGGSARLFSLLASLPICPLPGQGRQQLQPLHIDDAVEAILALLARPAAGGRIALVGPVPLALRDFLAALRAALGLGRPRFLPLPERLMAVAARVGDRWPASLFDSDSWQMLQRGNTADAAATSALLGRPPRAPARFIAERDAAAQRSLALLSWLLPLLRLAMALVWIVTGIVSLGVYPIPAGLALLDRAGVPPALAPAMLFGAALLDIALGIASLMPGPRRWLWIAQAALILFYTAVISLRLPEYWAHPYGPMLKNLPMLVALWLLHALEPPPARRRGSAR